MYFNLQQGYIDSVRKQKSKKRGKSKRRPQTKRCMEEETDTSSFSSTSISSREKWLLQNEKILESKKSQIIEQWKQEVRDEAERNRWDRRFQRYVKFYAKKLDAELFTLFAWLESFFGNLPLTIGAVALASANLGVVWFKFAEENLSSCEPVHFHSAQCSFPEVRPHKQQQQLTSATNSYQPFTTNSFQAVSTATSQTIRTRSLWIFTLLVRVLLDSLHLAYLSSLFWHGGWFLMLCALRQLQVQLGCCVWHSILSLLGAVPWEWWLWQWLPSFISALQYGLCTLRLLTISCRNHPGFQTRLESASVQ